MVHVEQRFLFDCRVVRLDVLGNWQIEWSELELALVAFTEFEDRWCQRIRPKDCNDPLFLPPPSFLAQSQVQNYWKRCDVYRKDESLTAANNLKQLVKSLHCKAETGGKYWLDDGGKRFRKASHNAQHGRTPEERAGGHRFRFCFPIEYGFHFDVDHDRLEKFVLLDYNKVNHKIEKRANVDPWGRIVGF